jgi:hypothetical protein
MKVKGGRGREGDVVVLTRKLAPARRFKPWPIAEAAIEPKWIADGFVQASCRRRTLVNVQRELSVALQHKTRDMLKIGSLLNEAKTFVEHGEWLPWLRRHTALTKRSAQNYMKAAAWADALDLKNAGAALFEPDLDHLSLEAILVLASGKFSAEILEQAAFGEGCRDSGHGFSSLFDPLSTPTVHHSSRAAAIAEGTT